LLASGFWILDSGLSGYCRLSEYIRKDSPFQARRVIDLIIKETHRLKNNTRIGHIVPEVREDTYRELKVFSYRIIYKILNEETVAVVGIVHARRMFDRDLIT
jgi:plasmid stabilization system protein ParE